MKVTATETTSNTSAKTPSPANAVVIEYKPPEKGKMTTVTAKIGGDVLHVETLDVTRSTARDRFAAAVCEGRPGIERQAIDAELLRIAAELAGGSSNGDGRDDGAHSQGRDPPELDTSRIVRPELFITTDVSGLAVPTMVAVGDTPVGQWRLHLRWKDGRREIKRLPQYIDLPSYDDEADDTAGKLWVHPKPAEPKIGRASCRERV